MKPLPVYKGFTLPRNTFAYELFMKKDLVALDKHLKEVNERQKQQLQKLFKMPEEKEMFQQALLCYGLV